MKTLRLKSVIVRWIATVIALVGFSGFAFAQTATPTATAASLHKEKVMLNKDLASIAQKQDRVNALIQKGYDEFNAGIKGTNTRTELIKARADLAKAKAYLRADKIDFLKVHQAFIDERKSTIKQETADLKMLQKNLNAELARGGVMAPTYAQEIIDKRNELSQNQTALKEEITNRNNDLLAANVKIREVNGQSATALAFEDSWAKEQNSLLEK